MEEVIDNISDYIKNMNQKMIIGISGHGASGKTTFVRKLIDKFEENEVNLLNTDPYIISSDLRKYSEIDYEYNNESYRSKLTACHPSAHFILALERDIQMIKKGLDFYTMETHYRDSTYIQVNKKINIIEGMSTAFVNPDLFDLKIYFYTDGDTELNRRAVRDINERGMELAYLKASHEQRRIQYELFMHPYHRNFNIVIKNWDSGYEIEKYDIPKM